MNFCPLYDLTQQLWQDSAANALWSQQWEVIGFPTGKTLLKGTLSPYRQPAALHLASRMW